MNPFMCDTIFTENNFLFQFFLLWLTIELHVQHIHLIIYKSSSQDPWTFEQQNCHNFFATLWLQEFLLANLFYSTNVKCGMHSHTTSSFTE